MNGLFKKVMMGGHHCQGKAGVIASICDAVLSIGSVVAVGMIGNHFAKKMDEEIEAEEETGTEAAIEFMEAEVEEEKAVEEETEEPKK